jgi:drug/metabolite transporter (DMT)-like permease
MADENITPVPQTAVKNVASHTVYGVLAGCLVVLIWSGWIVMSRNGVMTSFSIWDLAFLRFATAATIVLPFFLRKPHYWNQIFLPKVALPALACGTVYVLLSFAALRSSAAANAGVVVNGLMPIAAMILLAIMAAKRPSVADYGISILLLSANLILLGGGLISLSSFLFFLMATFSLAFYVVSVRLWKIPLGIFFFAVPIVNALVVAPLWFLKDGSFEENTLEDIAMQALYQGILVTLGALTLLTFCIKSIGPVSASVIMSTVPFATALLASIVLHEPVSAWHLFALLLCSTGIVVHALRGSS